MFECSSYTTGHPEELAIFEAPICINPISTNFKEILLTRFH